MSKNTILLEFESDKDAEMWAIWYSEVGEQDANYYTDYKTSKRSMAIRDVDSSFQLTVYYTAAKANGYADREINLKFDCLIKTQKPKFEQIYTERSSDHSAKAIKKIKQVWDGIQKGVFIPNDTSWKCKNCSYAQACKEWFERRIAL